MNTQGVLHTNLTFSHDEKEHTVTLPFSSKKNTQEQIAQYTTNEIEDVRSWSTGYGAYIQFLPKKSTVTPIAIKHPQPSQRPPKRHYTAEITTPNAHRKHAAPQLSTLSDNVGGGIFIK
ncbi:MAG: hypothetical protein J6M18_03955 [Actinomycetaceae bacterium]|nr:hypothetical protein [Actinomycetaceae bacterium]